MLISPAYAQAAASGGEGGMVMQLMPLVLIFAVFYFLLIRPQQKKVKEHKAMIAAVRRGDKVVTAGGVIGKVTKVHDDDRATVEIADGVRVDVVSSTLTNVLSRSEPASGGDKKDDAKGDDSGSSGGGGGGGIGKLASLIGGGKKSG